MCVGGKNVTPVSFLLPQSFTPPGHSLLLSSSGTQKTFISNNIYVKKKKENT